MARVKYAPGSIFIDSSNCVLVYSGSGEVVTYDILSYKYDGVLDPDQRIKTLDLDKVRKMLQAPIITPRFRISVLNEDETVDYVIPEEDIINNGISYSENYQNGQRRQLTIKLINEKIVRMKPVHRINIDPAQVMSDKQKELLLSYEGNPPPPLQISEEDNEILSNGYDGYIDIEHQSEKELDQVISEGYKYMPSIDGLWYGKKIKFDIGIEYEGEVYYFDKGVYRITNFSVSHSASDRSVTYTMKDKFSFFDGNTGRLDTGYEIPVGTPIQESITDLLNLSCPDGEIIDIKPCILDQKYAQFETQATIRIDEGGTMADIFKELATQMTAEYFYNSNGYLCFYPYDDSMNVVDKPIIWNYDEVEMQGIELEGVEDIINVVKVTGTSVDNKIYTYIAKNENLLSPINIQRIKERRSEPIESAAIWSDEMAQEFAEYNLRKNSLITTQQSIEVPFNPLIIVNNYVEITNKDLGLKRKRFIVNSVAFNSGNASMTLSVSNVDNLPMLGGIGV